MLYLWVEALRASTVLTLHVHFLSLAVGVIEAPVELEPPSEIEPPSALVPEG